MRPPSSALLRLESELRDPIEAIDVDLLQQLWRHDDIVIRCARPPGLEDQPDFGQRIRGAMGNVLEGICEAGVDDGTDENPHELLYFWHSPQVSTCFGPLELAVPMTVRAEMTSDTVEVVVRLFGRATIHVPMVAAAAIEALATGVSLRTHAIRVPFPVIDAERRHFDGGANDWPTAASSALLRYRSPLIIRQGDRLRLEPEAVVRSCLRRAAALAPWMGFALAADARALEAAIDTLRYELAIHPIHWTRTTRRDPGNPIEVFAYGGSMRMTGPLAPLLPYLGLAKFMSIGGQCASGFGAVELIFYP